MSATIYLKDLNVVVETVKEKKLIPTRRFSIDPNQDNMNIWDEKEYNKTFHFSEVTGKDSNGVDLPAFTSIQELEDYLSPFVNFKNGGGTGNNGGTTYEPSIEIDFFTPNSLNSSITTAQRIVVEGSFLDYVESVSFNASNPSGVSVSLVSKSFSMIELDIVCTSVVQNIDVLFNTPIETQQISIPVKNQRVIIPSNSGTGESLWKRGSTNGNQAVTGTGTFEAQDSGGNGWNDHAYYGPFQSPSTEIQHEFTISRLNSNSNAYAYIHFNTTNTATSGNQFPRFECFNGGIQNTFVNSQGNSFALPNFSVGDVVRIVINATSAKVYVNNVIQVNDSNNYSAFLTGVNFSVTAFRVYAMTNVKTTIIE